MRMRVRMHLRLRLGRRRGVFVVEPLGQRVIFGERFLAPVPVTASVGTRFRLKRFVAFLNARSQPGQHLPQHRIRFEPEEVRADLDRRVPVSQVVGGPGQGRVIRGGYHQNGLGRGFHADQAAIVGLQQGAGRERRAVRQQDRQFGAIVEGDELARFAAPFVGEFHHVCRCRTRRHRSEHSVGSEHLSSVQNRK